MEMKDAALITINIPQVPTARAARVPTAREKKCLVKSGKVMWYLRKCLSVRGYQSSLIT